MCVDCNCGQSARGAVVLPAPVSAPVPLAGDVLSGNGDPIDESLRGEPGPMASINTRCDGSRNSGSPRDGGRAAGSRRHGLLPQPLLPERLLPQLLRRDEQGHEGLGRDRSQRSRADQGAVADCSLGLQVEPGSSAPSPRSERRHRLDVEARSTNAPSPPLLLTLGDRLLAHNDVQAAVNRQRFAAAGVTVVNLLSSPGSGKTALLERLAGTSQRSMAVIVGYLATDNDARRLRAAGLPAVQITTGQACHLEASMVQRAVDALEAQGQPLAQLDLLLIENVGNLVCPAAYDLGESLRLVLLAAGEGEDKPLKYPALFHSADLVVISKIDLAEAVAFDRPQALQAIAAVAPTARVLECSARTGAGFEALLGALSPSPLPA